MFINNEIFSPVVLRSNVSLLVTNKYQLWDTKLTSNKFVFPPGTGAHSQNLDVNSRILIIRLNERITSGSKLYPSRKSFRIQGLRKRGQSRILRFRICSGNNKNLMTTIEFDILRLAFLVLSTCFIFYVQFR